MVEEKERAAKRAQEDEAIQAIIDDSKMDIPEPMLQLQCQQMVDGMAQQMAQQGLSMDSVLPVYWNKYGSVDGTSETRSYQSY